MGLLGIVETGCGVCCGCCLLVSRRSTWMFSPFVNCSMHCIPCPWYPAMYSSTCAKLHSKRSAAICIAILHPLCSQCTVSIVVTPLAMVPPACTALQVRHQARRRSDCHRLAHDHRRCHAGWCSTRSRPRCVLKHLRSHWSPGMGRRSICQSSRWCGILWHLFLAGVGAGQPDCPLLSHISHTCLCSSQRVRCTWGDIHCATAGWGSRHSGVCCSHQQQPTKCSSSN